MKNKPTDILIGEGIKEEHLNDASLGTALDNLFDAGLTELFYTIACTAIKQNNIEHRFVHLDTTSISLYGEYNSLDPDYNPHVIKITKGLSKDNAPELNQVIVSLMCTYRSSIPIWIESLSGNSSDKKSFRETIKKYRDNFQKKELPHFVCDSALYSKENIQKLSDIVWVIRVPETIKEAKTIIKMTNKTTMQPSKSPGYYYKEFESEYGGTSQRWICVYSTKAYEREYSTLVKNINKENEKKGKELWHLGNKPYACEADAVRAAKMFKKKLKYHQIEYAIESKNYFEKKGRPDKASIPFQKEYYISGCLKINPEAVEEAQSRKGFFIVATNEMNKEKLLTEHLLDVYKGQNISVERGFRFLKDPMFYAESLYLKTPSRIMALIMVMGLSLLVYALAERKIRKVMQENNLYIKNQKNKPTSKPTIRWVFQVFEGILYLVIKEGNNISKMVMNIEDDHRTILRCLGPPYEKIYFLTN
jgi:transposase